MLQQLFVFCLAATSALPRSTMTCLEVYNEYFENKYMLVDTLGSAKLLEKSTGKIIEEFSEFCNPYAKANVEYPVYVSSGKYGYRHVGIVDDVLLDLDSMSAINCFESARSGGNIHSSLTIISYADIPVNATFCHYPYYFKNLSHSGYGDNKHGTCCLVSMQILFDYYDAIFHEHVIESQYDTHVSGPYFSCYYFPQSPCSNGGLFHSYLINLCNSYCNVNIESDHTLSWINQNHLINHYIGAVRYLDYSNNTSEGNWADIFSGHQFSVVMDGIDAGRPVILNNLSHSMVAFAYDSDYVYVMTGWKLHEGVDKKIAKMDWDDYNGNIFTNYPSAYDLILTCDHECTEGYYSTTMGRYICPICG